MLGVGSGVPIPSVGTFWWPPWKAAIIGVTPFWPEGTAKLEPSQARLCKKSFTAELLVIAGFPIIWWDFLVY